MSSRWGRGRIIAACAAGFLAVGALPVSAQVSRSLATSQGDDVSEERLAEIMRIAKPAEASPGVLGRMARSAPGLDAAERARPRPMKVMSGRAGPRPRPVRARADVRVPTGRAGESVDAARNFGVGNEDSPYHYTEAFVPQVLQGTYPYRATGRFFFQQTSDPNSWRWCTGSLISNSILLVAGHCVHRGTGGEAGWIKAGIFHPGYYYGPRQYGCARAVKLATTQRWYTQGDGAGADVGLVGLAKRCGRNNELGHETGYWPFCYENCYRPYWHHTRLSYPENYENGQFMIQGQSLSVANGFGDYIFGSGAQSGVSGSPLVSNFGFIADSLADQGRSPERNVIMGIAGFLFSPSAKKVGGSSLSNINNSNNFKALYNNMCTQVRTLHGTASCTMIP
jgi:V8-like Glu-specific endopeptidase